MRYAGPQVPIGGGQRRAMGISTGQLNVEVAQSILVEVFACPKIDPLYPRSRGLLDYPKQQEDARRTFGQFRIVSGKPVMHAIVRPHAEMDGGEPIAGERDIPW